MADKYAEGKETHSVPSQKWREEDASSAEHSEAYYAFTESLRLDWNHHVFFSEDMPLPADLPSRAGDAQYTELLAVISSSLTVLKMYVAEGLAFTCSYGHSLGIPRAPLEYLKRKLFVSVANAASVEEVSQIAADSAVSFRRLYQRYVTGNYSLPVRRAVEQIHRRLFEKTTASDIAADVHLHPAYLSRRFKEETGLTVSAYILQVKMETARQMLQDAVYSPTEAAEILGYQDYAYFSRVFSRYFGMSPRAFISSR